MVRKSETGDKILEFMERVYPQCVTVREVCSEIGVPYGCGGGTVSDWIKTLLSSGRAEFCGKKGRANSYRFKK